MLTGKDIRAKRRALGLSGEELANILGVSKDNLYKWEKGHMPSNPEDYMKVERWLAGEIVNVSKSTPVSNLQTDSGHGPTITIIDRLSRSSEAHGLADKDRAASELLREQNNSRMIDLLSKQNEAAITGVGQSVNVQQEIHEVVESRLSAFLAALSLVASGKRWKSATEAGAALHKFVYGGYKNEKGKGIRDGSGK